VTSHLIAGGLNFPTSITFDDGGRVFVAESGLAFGGQQAGGRVLMIREDGGTDLVGDGFRPPVNGLSSFDGALLVSEGGHPGRISRLELDGRRSVLLDDLPGPGNYHTNMVIAGPDGWLYFSQGAMTNSGVVGLDAYELGWLRRLPHAQDLPGFAITLRGVNFESANPFSPDDSPAITGAFLPFGTASHPGQCLPAKLPCTASVMRCKADGGQLELVAWGLRNAYGLGFTADGRLLAIDQGADERGSRPIGGAPDVLFEVVAGGWYGWPDYIAGEPVTLGAFRPVRGPVPDFILDDHSSLPDPAPALFRFAPHSAATKFCVDGDLLHVALFGDERPMTAPEGPRLGRSVVSVNMRDWSMHEWTGASFHRPIDVALHPKEHALYVVDFGHFEMLAAGGLDARPGSGAVWRIG
jgi:glucose/arabinose dehydrogenase